MELIAHCAGSGLKPEIMAPIYIYTVVFIKQRPIQHRETIEGK